MSLWMKHTAGSCIVNIEMATCIKIERDDAGEACSVVACRGAAVLGSLADGISQGDAHELVDKCLKALQGEK